MANLSNINNILRTGSLGVGINRDPASPFEVSSATKPGIKMFNTAASGKTYQAYSDVNGSYIIYDEDADSNRLTINSAGNATFAGDITINPGSSTVATETFRRDTNGDGQIIGDINFNTTAAEGTDDRIGLIRGRTSGGAATSRGGELLFYTRKSGSSDFNLTTYDRDGNWTFPGSVTFTSNIYADRYYADTTTKQTDALFIGRQNGNIVEFGHNNQSAQYYGVLGVQGSSGYPFIGFSCDIDYGANTFTTRGAKGNVIQGSGGNLSFQTVDNTNATGQTPNTRMVILNGGNVGIGTISPQQKLHINGNVRVGTDTGFIDFARPGGDIVGGIGWHTDDYFYVAGHPTAGTGAGNSVRVYAFGSLLSLGNPTAGDVLTVDVNGRVGIGTTSPDYKLDVESTTDSQAGAYIQAGKSSQGEIQNTGLIIGSRTDTATGDYVGISFNGNAAVPARGRAAVGAVSINGASGMDLVFMTRNAGDGTQLGASDEKMRITSAGNVGINNTNPSAFNSLGGKNVVIGDGTQTNNLTLFSATTGGGVGYGHIAFADSNTSGSSAQYAGLIQYYHGNDSMQFYTNATPRMTILNSGNVGIGTTNPGAKLTISGGDIYQLGSSGGYSQTKVLPKTTPNFPSAGSQGTPQNWYQPVRGESGIIYYGNVNNAGGEYRCAGFVVFSAAESNNTPVAITIAATESIGANMLSFSTASGWIQIQNTYGYAIIVMGRVESFVP